VAEEFLIRMAVIRTGLIETSIDTFESLVLSEDWGAEQAPRDFTQTDHERVQNLTCEESL
jgi:hypothetical protein